MAFDPTDPYAGASSYAAIAEQAARTAYLDAQRRGQGESDALNAAKFAWQKTMDEAGLTGLYQGKPTMAASQLRGFFGSGAGEFSGMPTTEEQRISGYTDAGKTPTLSREQFLADTTGYYNGGATLAREQGQDKTTLGLLGILSGLRGPSDYFQYQKVLGGTPRGYADVVNQAFGRAYAPMGAGANLAAAEPASLQTMQRDINQGARYPQGAPMASGAINAGATAVDPMLAPAAPAAAGTGFGASGMLSAPNQIDPQAWSRYAPSTKKLISSDYEAGGLDPADVDWMRRLSLPSYRGAQRGSLTGMFGS